MARQPRFLDITSRVVTFSGFLQRNQTATPTHPGSNPLLSVSSLRGYYFPNLVEITFEVADDFTHCSSWLLFLRHSGVPLAFMFKGFSCSTYAKRDHGGSHLYRTLRDTFQGSRHKQRQF